ncbi:MAG: hypothetical protein JW915_23130 [Chitinispirillaceae bacterium]|nr:hypothetical protein [Chitinispirillaceae bacterium]
METRKNQVYYSELYKKLYSSPVPVTISSIEDDTWIDVNDAFCRLIEHAREEIIGHTSIELNLIDPQSRAEIRMDLIPVNYLLTIWNSGISSDIHTFSNWNGTKCPCC